MPVSLTHLHAGLESCIYFPVTTRESGFMCCHTWIWNLAHPCKYIPFATWIRSKMTTKPFLIFHPSLYFYNECFRMIVLCNEMIHLYLHSCNTNVLPLENQIFLTSCRLVYPSAPMFLFEHRIHLKLAFVNLEEKKTHQQPSTVIRTDFSWQIVLVS